MCSRSARDIISGLASLAKSHPRNLPFSYAYTMVSVTASASTEHQDDAAACALISAGLSDAERASIERALAFIGPLYRDRLLGTGEPAREHALGTARGIAQLRLDVDTRTAGLLFAAHEYLPDAPEKLSAEFGPAVAALVAGISQLNQLRVVTRSASGERSGPKQQAQTEVLRKMLLAMVGDIRVVLLRLASRTQTLRYLTRGDTAPGNELARERREAVARETLDIYAPLANRLGVWQFKWELEDLSFRFLEPETYRGIAAKLDERRIERAQFIASAIGQLQRELKLAGIEADISGRPKHIFSIYNKMRAKSLDFSEVYDVRGVRVLVDSVKDCYTVLGIVHNLWQPIPKEFDDYISRPKGNFYRSLHTAVIGPDERALEVQIRTHDMHHHAELGVAAHWRYKESSLPKAAGARPARSNATSAVAGGGIAGGTADGLSAGGNAIDDRIAWLRQVLAWRDDVVDASDWVAQSKQAALDDTVYVLTPQGHVIDLPRGATPVDFAYALHSDLGHRCRGAKVNGAIVPLDRELENGERVEIIAARKGPQPGGPSRDWLNPALGYIRSSRARSKVRQWFNNQELAQLIAAGRAALERELQREGATGAGHEDLARRLGFDKAEDLYAALERDEVGPRQLQKAIRNDAAGAADEPDAGPDVKTRGARAAPASSGILVVGVDRLMTQLAKCCKPAPPDPIAGFITRGRGMSIHRASCASLLRLRERQPERVIGADWGKRDAQVFSADIVVRASDRTGLLRDISEILSREKINVTAVKTLSKQSVATMYFTVEIGDVGHLKRTLAMIGDIKGVFSAGRR